MYRFFSARQGYSLLEIALVVLLTSIIASFIAANFFGFHEQADASVLTSVHGQLQSVVSQAVTLLEKPATQLSLKQVADALEHNGDRYTVTAPDLPATPNPSNRGQRLTITLLGKPAGADVTVEAEVDACGNVCLLNLVGLSHYALVEEPRLRCTIPSPPSVCRYIKPTT
ncbi:MAG: Tfp pilus assembly protein FimT/FimU [Vampirovibrionales bacterium]